MRGHRLYLGILLAGIAGFSSGQVVEATIHLPDSIVGIQDPRAVVLADAGRRCFVGGDGPWLVGIDCATGAKLGRIEVDSNVVGLCANPTGTKLWSAHSRGQDGVVAVVDPVRMTQLARITVGNEPVAMGWSGCHNAVYCLTGQGASLTVICAHGDSVLGTVPVRSNPVGMAYSEALDRLYVWHRFDRWMSVLDGASGALVDTVDIGPYPSAALLDPAAQYLYVAYGQNLAVLACSSNLVEARLWVGLFPVDLSLDRVNRRLFLALRNSDAVRVVDCDSRQPIGQVQVGDSPRYLAWDSIHGRILCTNYFGRSVDIIDPVGLGASRVAVRPQPARMVWNRLDGRTYVLHQENAGVSIVDADTACLAGSLVLWETPLSLFWSNGRLFCLTANERAYAIDGLSNQVMYGVDVGPEPAGLVADSAGGKFYVSNYRDSTVTVFAAESGQELSRVKVGAFPLCLGYNPLGRKVYVCRQLRMQIIDARVDSVKAGVSSIGRGSEMLFNARTDKLYCIDLNTNSVVVVDGTTNGVVGTARAGEDPSDLGLNPFNDEVYCLYPGQHRSIVIGDSSNALEDTMVVPGYPSAAWGSGTNGRVYVGDRDQDKVYVFEPAGHELLDSIPGVGDASAIFWNVEDGLVYCSDRSGGRLLAIDPSTNTVIETLAVGSKPAAMAYNPGQGRLYVMNQGSSTISVVKCPAGVAEPDECVPGRCRARLLPNPVRAGVAVRVRGTGLIPTRVELADVAGRVVRRWSRTAEGADCLLLGPAPEAGVYMMLVQTAAARHVEKLVVVE